MERLKNSLRHTSSHLFVGLLSLLFLLSVSGCSTVPSLSQPLLTEKTSNGDFWIGEVGPIASHNAMQNPFICSGDMNGLGQPLVDNHEGVGHAVYPQVFGFANRLAKPTGHSRYCSVATRVDYFYYSVDNERFLPLANPRRVPADVEKITFNGKEINFVVRVERGTINRFLYSIAMLAPFEESLASPQTLDNSAWNGKLVYKFAGGVGLGHWQGQLRLSKGQELHYASLKRGYAVAFSTGSSTVTHYNLKLAAETVAMVKQHFGAMYGQPQHTIGIGGSGGAIQQYVFAEHYPGLIDAAIPQLSYPDMVTQTIYVADCDLLERYFDQAYHSDPETSWGDWQQRAKVVGLNASGTNIKLPRVDNPYAPKPGGSTCSHGWRGEIQKIFNPYWAPKPYLLALGWYGYPDSVAELVKWSYWNDLEGIYPQDAQGFAPNSWDNVGVQYGLQALKSGELSVGEFLRLNACVGGWKQPQEMGKGAYPWNANGDKSSPDPWDQANMNLSQGCADGTPAPRTTASPDAIRAAIHGKQVFGGKAPIPIVDVRWYLEPVLDIHHSLGSFSVRARMIRQQGHSDNQVIWVVACDLEEREQRKECAYEPTADALDLIESWLQAIKNNPAAGVVGNKPSKAVDACFDNQGELIHSGADVWDGVLDQQAAGKCLQQFPVYPTSRMIAGEGIEGDLFKCALKPVSRALADGTYANVVFSPAQRVRLEEIFNTGVCDY